MNRFHIAIATDDIDTTIEDYSARFGARPCSFVAGEYALWRTDTLNVSVRRDPSSSPGSLGHLGREDATAPEFTQDVDANGIARERFSAGQQADEINGIRPLAGYRPQ